MKLDPVYLLAPEPQRKPAATCSRRTLAAWTIASAVLGWASGTFSARVWFDREPAPSAADASLAWALELQSGPLSALLASSDGFLARVVTYEDPRLHRGLHRLCDAVLSDEFGRDDERATLARKLAIVLRAIRCGDELTALAEKLERVR
ncbi:MAG: hypothetical protein HZB39_12890 [Planctomycetes bacterium]|nr:hypothetical protein [Planctomycetota bacterium]